MNALTKYTAPWIPTSAAYPLLMLTVIDRLLDEGTAAWRLARATAIARYGRSLD